VTLARTGDGRGTMAVVPPVRMLSPRAVARQAIIGAGRRIIVPRVSGRIIILCYHSVHPKRPFGVTPEGFERHLTWLKAYCDLVGFTDVVSLATQAGRLKRHAVAITFDDGYRDNYEFAFPLLQRHRVLATFFLTAGYLERDPAAMETFQAFLRGRPDVLKPLEWTQVREMRRAGMSFGAHSYSHRNLARLSPSIVEREGKSSKDIIESRVGDSVYAMAYPFGLPGRHYTVRTAQIMAAAGYKYAASTVFRSISQRDSQFALPRYPVSEDDLDVLRDQVSGAWDFLGCVRERLPWLVCKGGGDW